MRALFVDAFGDAAAAVASARLGVPVRCGTPSSGSPSLVVTGIAALVGLTGGLQGRLTLDLDALAASAMAADASDERSGVSEFTEEVAAHALAALRGAGVKIESTPPMVFTGRDLEVTNSRMETVTVPITIPEGTLVVSIAAREGEA